MNKRGQRAMEFLITYGWAILAMIIVIGALGVYFYMNSQPIVTIYERSCKPITIIIDPETEFEITYVNKKRINLNFRDNNETIVRSLSYEKIECDTKEVEELKFVIRKDEDSIMWYSSDGKDEVSVTVDKEFLRENLNWLKNNCKEVNINWLNPEEKKYGYECQDYNVEVSNIK